MLEPFFSLRIDIEKKNPLKQGLKLDALICDAICKIDWKEESIKTRIETHTAVLDQSITTKLKRRIH